MKFEVYSRKEVQNILPNIPYVNITICNCDMDHIIPGYNEYNKGILSLKFRDADSIDKAKHFGYIDEMFTFSQAQEILNFIFDKNNQVRNDIELIIVNCVMGRCRSAAIAACLSKIINGDDFNFFKGKFNPNMFVYRTLMEQYYRNLDKQ